MGYLFDIHFEASGEREVALDKAIKALDKAMSRALESANHNHPMDVIRLACQGGMSIRTITTQAKLCESISPLRQLERPISPSAWPERSSLSIRGR